MGPLGPLSKRFQQEGSVLSLKQRSAQGMGRWEGLGTDRQVRTEGHLFRKQALQTKTMVTVTPMVLLRIMLRYNSPHSVPSGVSWTSGARAVLLHHP